MPVHVGELHTEVVPADGAEAAGPEVSREPEWTREQRAAETRARAEWLRWRVAAEGFND